MRFRIRHERVALFLLVVFFGLKQVTLFWVDLFDGFSLSHSEKIPLGGVVTTKEQNKTRVRLSEPFCFVHIGKTAGGSISCRLGHGLGRDCPFRNFSDSLASVEFTGHVLGKLHKNENRGCVDKTNDIAKSRPTPSHYLFSIRDPVDRLFSWFVYEHPALNLAKEVMGNRPYLYKLCFNTLESLATSGLGMAIEGVEMDSSGTKHSFIHEHIKTCALRAWKAVRGEIGFQYHNAYNYQYYWDWVHNLNANATIMVIRHDHLQTDWNRLVALYSGDANLWSDSVSDIGNTIQPAGSSSTRKLESYKTQERDYFNTMRLHVNKRPTSLSSSSSYATISKNLSSQALANLCLVLCEELMVYRRLIDMAINLTPRQRQESLSALHRKCPKVGFPPIPTEGGSSSTECPLQLHPSIQSHTDPVDMVQVRAFSS